jgi:hypothetical protein
VKPPQIHCWQAMPLTMMDVREGQLAVPVPKMTGKGEGVRGGEKIVSKCISGAEKLSFHVGKIHQISSSRRWRHVNLAAPANG